MLRIHKASEKEIWKKAYRQFYEKISELNAEHQKALILLSGGSAINLYQMIADNIKHDLLRLYSYVFAQVDERFQPKSTNEINAKHIQKTGLTHALREKNIAFFTISQKKSFKESFQKYDQTISDLFRQFKYRIAIFGIGEDCHVAGLLPGFRQMWDIDKYVVGYQNDGKFPQRISITPKTIRKIDHVIIVAAGHNKQNALEKIQIVSKASNLDKYPARIVHDIKRVEIFRSQDIGDRI